MQIVRTIAEVTRRPSNRDDRAVSGSCPTMGAFHAGHLSLFEAARRECDAVVVSLFVNPTQFGEQADLERYPRDEGHDAAIAERAGVDVLFAPAATEIYRRGIRHLGRGRIAQPHARGRVSSRPFSRRRHDLPQAFSHRRPQSRLFRAEGCPAGGGDPSSAARSSTCPSSFAPCPRSAMPTAWPCRRETPG